MPLWLCWLFSWGNKEAQEASTLSEPCLASPAESHSRAESYLCAQLLVRHLPKHPACMVLVYGGCPRSLSLLLWSRGAVATSDRCPQFFPPVPDLLARFFWGCCWKQKKKCSSPALCLQGCLLAQLTVEGDGGRNSFIFFFLWVAEETSL